MVNGQGILYFLKQYEHGTLKVRWGSAVLKHLRQTPPQVAAKFRAWVLLVELTGLREVRKRPGFHDEPLKGDRMGQRSIRLNRSYRAVYVERCSGAVELIEVVEVTKHEY